MTSIDLSSLFVPSEPCDRLNYHCEMIIEAKLTQHRFDWFKANGWSLETPPNNSLLIFKKPKSSGDRGNYWGDLERRFQEHLVQKFGDRRPTK